jgi:16S rRNA (uracil1498-N3)-methyltransferase
MNLMLLDEAVGETVLRCDDPRAKHVRDMLGMKTGDSFDVGALEGPRGKATIVSDDVRGMALRIEWNRGSPKPMPVVLVVGMSRPQTMRKVLRAAPEFGLRKIVVAGCVRSEPGYAESSLWKDGEWHDILRLGAEQSFSTHIPAVEHRDSLASALETIARESCDANHLALDNYEAATALSSWSPSAVTAETVLCVGPERGWDGTERDVLRKGVYTLAHLGPRVLRTETAVVAGLALVASKLGAWNDSDTPNRR